MARPLGAKTLGAAMSPLLRLVLVPARAACRRLSGLRAPSPRRAPRRAALALAGLLTFGIGSGAHAALIDFSGLPEGNNPNPLALAGATFTTIGGFNVLASGSNSLCPSISSTSPANCSRVLEIGFDMAAQDIRFEFWGNNNHVPGSDIGDVEIYAGATLLDTLDVLVVDDDGSSFDLVSLAGFSGVTRLVISSTDFGGVLYDNFRFDPAAGVPAPAPWALVLAAAGLGVGFRRRAVRA